MTTATPTRPRPTAPIPARPRRMTDRESQILWGLGKAHTALAEDLLNQGGADVARHAATVRRLLADLLDGRGA